MTETLRLRVARHTVAADGVVVLELRHEDGRPLPDWAPGAHIDLLMAPGLTRQYSLCGDPTDRHGWRVAVRREPDGRGGSRHIHDTLSAGDQVEAGAPRNRFPLRPASRYLFLAGGIGITPILPMLAAATTAGARWELHYAGRTGTAMAFGEELAAAHGDRVTLYPEDERGLIDLDGLIGRQEPGTLVYCCGPEGMLTAVEQCCARWPDRPLHVERFSATAVTADGGEFEVELARSGRTVKVLPGVSVLEAVERAGVDVLSSCREGTCGTCETTVLAGEVDHRDSLLTAAEQAAHDIMFICVSRAASPRLILDL
ncbi:PDR/VanB family oxidoreductase [Actinoplanes sp. NPDC051851]|uniref:PDR/VanB family oxidoreductase n=1 Tax=Actinoplanes sp. NPDC051851 TaxID=3154753 RepID=UPI00342ABE79